MVENTNVKLADVCKDVSYGYTASATAEIVGPKFLRITDIQGGEVDWGGVPYCEVDEVNLVKNKLKKGDIVVARTGNSTGENYIYDEDIEAVFASYLIRFRVDEALANPYFVWLQMRSNSWWSYVSGAKSGSAQAGANAKVLGKFEFFLPEREIQNQAVDSVLNFNKKIELNRQINQTLESMAQTIFKSWFVDFEPVRAKIAAIESGEDAEGVTRAAMRAISGKTDDELDKMEDRQAEEYAQLKSTAELFPSAMQDSELGEVPERWEVKKVSHFVELAYGKSLKKTVRVKGEIPVYGSGGVNGTHNISLVEGPGIIVGRKGTVGSLYWEDRSFYPIDTVYYIKPIGEISLEFAYYLFQTLGLEYMNTDAAVPGLNRENVYRLEVPGFDEKLIACFTDTVKSVRIKIASSLSEIHVLKNLRDTLLPKLLSGELSVDALKITNNQGAQ